MTRTLKFLNSSLQRLMGLFELNQESPGTQTLKPTL